MTRTCLLCIFPDIGHGFTTVNRGLRINTYMQALKIFSLSLLPLFTHTRANKKDRWKQKQTKTEFTKMAYCFLGSLFSFQLNLMSMREKNYQLCSFHALTLSVYWLLFLTAKEEMCSQKRSEIGRNSLILGAEENLSTLIYLCLFFHHPSFIHELCNFSIHNRVFQTILPQPINL